MYKDINGYEGMYQVNELGDVLSLISGKVLKPFEKESGYLIVNLYKEGKRKNHFVHKLVATAFLDNAESYTEVNHKDGNKSNNRVDNLEWVSRSENISHAMDSGLLYKDKLGKFSKCGLLA